MFRKVTLIKSFSFSSFSCLPMKVCEPEVYAKHIVQPWDMHCTCLFLKQFEFWCLYSPKDFKIHQVHMKLSYRIISSILKIGITNIKQNFKIMTLLKNICSLVYSLSLCRIFLSKTFQIF